MKKNILLIVFCIIYNTAFSQQKDSLVYIQDSVKIINLGEAVVTGYSKNMNQCLQHFYKNNSSITTEDILSRLPEISLIRRGSYGMEPLIRSFNAEQVSVLLDGMRIHGACTDKMDPVTIYVEPLNLQNIQLQSKNGFVTGSNIGGTINMQLAQPQLGNNKTFTGTLSSGYQGSAHSFYEGAVVHFSKEKWALRANVTYRKSNNYKDGSGKTVEYTQYEKANYSVSAKLKLNMDWVGKIDLLMDDGWNIGYAALPMDVGYAGARIGSVGAVRENSQKKWQRVELKIYSNIIRHFMDDTHRKNVKVHMDMPGLSKTTGAYTEAKYKMGKKENLLLRGDISTTFLKASMTMHQYMQPDMYMLTWPDNREIQSGISAVCEYRPDSLSLLKLSTRLDFIKYALTSKTGKEQLSVFNNSTSDKNYFLKNISAELIRKITKRIQAGLNVSYSERAITANELYGYYLYNSFDGYDYIGNMGLRNENSLKAEGNLSFSLPKIRFFVSGYLARVNNYIIGSYDSSLSVMTIGANGVKVFKNVKYAMVDGMEAGIYYKPFSTVQIVSVAKYERGSDNNNIPLPLIAPFKNVISVNKELKHFSLQIETETAACQNRVRTSFGEKSKKGYFKANLRAFFSNYCGKNMYKVEAGVENIFNTVYKEHLDWGKTNRPGRNIYIHFSLSF